MYASEMGITLFLDVDRYTLEDAKVELFYHLELENGSWEEVPMGIFEVTEANRKIKCLDIKAYDYMLRFDETFNGFETFAMRMILWNFAVRHAVWNLPRQGKK